MWRDLIRIAAPAAAALSSQGPRRTGVLQGYLAEQDNLEAERQRKAQQEQAQQQHGAEVFMRLAEQMDAIDDPVVFEQHRKALLDLAPVLRLPVSTINAMQFNHTNETQKRVAQARAMLQQQQDLYGIDMNDPSHDANTLVYADGTKQQRGEARRMVQGQEFDPGGNQLVPPPRVKPIEGATETERNLSAWARDHGKKLGELTSAERQQATKEIAAGSANPTAPKDPSDFTSRYLDNLVALWKQANPGKDVPADVQKSLMLQAKKDIGQADDRPLQRGPGGLAPGQEFQMSERLAKNWQDATKATREMTRQFDLMQTGLKRFQQGDKNGGSQAVLVTFQKILDPTSVVRESEYARSAEGISLMRRIDGFIDRLASGGAGVPYAELAGMVETARQFVDNMKTYAAGTRRRIEAQTKRYQIDPALVFDDASDNTPASPSRGGVSVQAPDGQTYQFPNQAAADRFKAAAGIR